MYEINRSIVLLIDGDTGEEVNAYSILGNVDESIAARMREVLAIAQKSGIYKYSCAYCGQPLCLKHRMICKKNENDENDENEKKREVYFFAHFPKSKDCPAKTEYTPSLLGVFRENRFRESELHKEMMQNITRVLEQDHTLNNVRIKQRISKPEILHREYRIPDAYFTHDDKEFAFDFLIYTALIGTIADRNIFYRTIGTYMMWLFPYFDENAQRMCEKDIFYTHRRNVFVFDARSFYRWNKEEEGRWKPVLPPYENRDIFAHEESIARKCLCLKCYWQEPVLEDNEIHTKWHHKLVTLDELTFDEETKEAYYIDSDRLFYEKADEKTRTLYDEWYAAKESRWKEFFDEMITGRLSDSNVNTEKIHRYKDEQTQLWGYKYNDIEIIPAKYYDVLEFAPSGMAFVKKTIYWGIIDVYGHRVRNFNIKEVSMVENGGYNVDGHYYDTRLREIIPENYTRFYLAGEHIEATKGDSADQEIGLNDLPNDFTICRHGKSDIYDKYGRIIAERCIAYKVCDHNHTIFVAKDNGKYYYGLYHAQQHANIISEHTTQYTYDSLKGTHNFIQPNGNKQEEYKESYDEYFEYIIPFIPLSPNLYKGLYKKKWRLYNENHRTIIEKEFDDICQVADIVVCKTKGTGFMNDSYSLYTTDGQRLTNETFSEYEDRGGILYVLHEGEMYPYIKEKGIMPIQEELFEDVCSLKFERKYALAIRKLRVTNYEYSRVEYMGYGLVNVTDYDTALHGVFNNKGEQIFAL